MATSSFKYKFERICALTWMWVDDRICLCNLPWARFGGPAWGWHAGNWARDKVEQDHET